MKNYFCILISLMEMWQHYSKYLCWCFQPIYLESDWVFKEKSILRPLTLCKSNFFSLYRLSLLYWVSKAKIRKSQRTLDKNMQNDRKNSIAKRRPDMEWNKSNPTTKALCKSVLSFHILVLPSSQFFKYFWIWGNLEETLIFDEKLRHLVRQLIWTA